MRILVLCKRFYTNKDLLADRYGRLFQLPMELGRIGHDVAVMAADYRNREAENLVVGSVSFSSHPVRHPFAFPRLVGAADSFAATWKPDVVMASGDTPLGWLGSHVATKQDVPFVFDVYDNYRTFASARFPGMGWMLNRVMRRADLTTVVSRGLKELHEEGGRFLVVPNGADPKVFRPLDRNVQRATLGIDPNLTLVGYVGAVDKDRGIETLLESVEILRSTSTDIRLLMAGPNIVHKRFPRFVDYRGVLDQLGAASLINACDVVVLPYPETEWARYTSANKIYEYLSCGVPVVATDISDYRDLIDVSEAICRPSDPADMARAIAFQLESGVSPKGNDMTWETRAASLSEALLRL